MIVRAKGAHRRPRSGKTAIMGITLMALLVIALGATWASQAPGPERPVAVITSAPYTAPQNIIERTTLARPAPVSSPEVARISPVPVPVKTYAPAHVPVRTYSPAPRPTSSGPLSGTLSCAGLEALWISAGGASSHAFMAAEIAKAESGGRQYAHSPTNDFGYWQINGSHGPSMATYDPVGNAKAAISISGDGTDWNPWTTYTSGAYVGKCATLTSQTRIGIPPVSSGSTPDTRAFAWALTQAGKRYVFGGSGPSTYDCSGLVMRAFQNAGVSIPRTTGGMSGSRHFHRTYSPVRGDVVLWFSGGSAIHVEFYVNSNETFGAHSSAHPIIGYATMWSQSHAYYHVT